MTDGAERQEDVPQHNTQAATRPLVPLHSMSQTDTYMIRQTRSTNMAAKGRGWGNAYCVTVCV